MQHTAAMDAKPLLDVQSIRDSARRQLQNGAVTPNYGVDRDVVLRLLNDALATEIVSLLTYKRQYFMAKTSGSTNVIAILLEHAAHDQLHIDRLADRIVQLGGVPDFSPAGLAQRSHAARNLLSLVEEVSLHEASRTLRGLT